MTIPFIRTPDSRFDELDVELWPVNYIEIDGLRMAYSDEGSGTAGTMLLLHGEPTWGFLFHRMYTPLISAGWRLIIPDLIGFGRSDKPVNRSDHTYANHVRWVGEFLSKSNVVSSQQPDAKHGFCAFYQDWGGLIGLRVVAEHPEWFDKLVLGNTVLPDCTKPMSDGFMHWQNRSQTMNPMDPGRLVAGNCQKAVLTEAEQDAYRAPFPDESYMAGARELPMMVPTSADNVAIPANQEAWRVLERWQKPVLTAWNTDDFVLGQYQSEFISRIPGAKDQPHRTYSGGHFIQEDSGEELVTDMIQWFEELRD